MAEQDQEIHMDADALWREETYTDQRVGTIRVMTPVTRDGGPDQSRQVQYIGQASIFTPAGALPVNFELEGPSLSDACRQFGPAARKAVDETMEQLREMRREQASSIVVPGQGSGKGGIQVP